MNLPTGTVTFLFTDIEGSTTLWERYPETMPLALKHHDELLRTAIEAHHGYVFKTVGDAFCAAFPSASDALRSALKLQLALLEQEWGEMEPLRVRVGLHTGVAQERDNDYFGPTLNRVARLQGIGHGQQTLLSQTTYEMVKTELADEVTLSDLGVHRLKDLAAPEHVWQLTHPSLPQEFPPLLSLNYLSTNLPQQLTSFIGREREMTEVKQLLSKTRLLTLTGSGGTGKTRLALQVSAEVLEQYADGVWLVEFASLSDEDLVPQTVASALSVREAPGEPITRTLLSWLKDEQMLLVLDNCEHLLETLARFVDALLKFCPNVRVLASSREALGIAGESAYRMPSLTVPPLPPSVLPPVGGSQGGHSHLQGDKGAWTPESVGHYESVRLFVERAALSGVDFTITSQNAAVLASVCHRLDGIPLAIELAAARVRSLPIEEIHARLDNRFRLLTSGSRAALPRHQTLRALIDWSYDLLKAEERSLLNRLSVFAGGWRLQAVYPVCAGDSLEDWEVLDLLTSLVDKSLVVYEEQEGRGRYRLLETVRQYAQDRLKESGENDAVQERHRDYFLALAEEAEPKLKSADQVEWLQRLDAEHENLRMALDWSLSEEAKSAAGLRLCGALSVFWSTRGHLTEGREWCARVLDKADSKQQTPERAKALHCAGNLAYFQGDYTSASAYHEQGLTIRKEIGDQSGIAWSLNNLGAVAFGRGDYASARAYHQESLSLRKEIRDRDGIAASLNNLGSVASAQSDYVAARAYLEESLLFSRQTGDRNTIASALGNLGVVAYSQGDYVAARAYQEENLALKKEMGDRYGIALSLINLGNVTSDQGDYVSARAYYEESLVLRREIGDRHGIAWSLNDMGAAASAQGDYASALTYLEESLALHKEIGNRFGVAESLHNLGYVVSSQGDYGSAQSHFEESLTIRNEVGYQRGIAGSLQSFASLAARENNTERAVLFWGAAEALREKIGAPLTPNDQDKFDREVAEARRMLDAETFAVAWAKGRTVPIEQTIALALEGSDPSSPVGD